MERTLDSVPESVSVLVQFERKLCLRRRVIETFKRQFPSLSTDTLNGRPRHGGGRRTAAVAET